jgi:hypothetical protein
MLHWVEKGWMEFSGSTVPTDNFVWPIAAPAEAMSMLHAMWRGEITIRQPHVDLSTHR